MSPRLLEILDLPLEQREDSARAYAERHPDQAQVLRRLLAHAKVIEEAEARGFQTPPLERLRKLRERLGASRRYDIRGEVNRGGMGIIERVWDDDLGRSIAMKVMLGDPGEQSGAEPGSPSKLERFIAEAQITSQLDHPGVIPVYDVGIDDDGRIFFTMPFVKGRTASEIFRYVREKKHDWDLSRALEVLLKVCDTLAFAHERSVVHRDVKPSNIMVGRFGEVYVVDWGLAKVHGQAEETAGRPRIGSSAAHTVIHTDRSKKRDGSSSATQAGTILGTPSYMSPEQGFGRIDEVGPATDIYSVGALLYTLLTGYEPYQEPGVTRSPQAVLDSLLAGPPEPIAKLAPSAPPELVAISEKAMARRLEQRFSSMKELSRDLRDFLAGRVVQAHRTGAWAEIRKWIKRNRAVAAASALALSTLFAGLCGSLYLYAREAELAAGQLRSLRDRLALESLSLAERVDELRERALELELDPVNAARMGRWVTDAQALLGAVPQVTAVLEEISSAAHVEDPGFSRYERWLRTELAATLVSLERLRGSTAEPRDDALWRQETSISQMEKRIAAVRGFEREWSAHAVAWKRAANAVERSEKYGDLDLVPQAGLVPLGEDPATGLQEFWHIASGSAPKPYSDGPSRGSSRWKLTEATGIVLVLLPGGTFDMGAAPDPDSDPASRASRCKDERAKEWEGPGYRDLALDPFFLSRYELTQGQWMRLNAMNPSFIHAGRVGLDVPITLLHPVESATWTEARDTLDWVGLVLPSEAQWEYACRAGTMAPWWTGRDAASVAFVANLMDESFSRTGLQNEGIPEAWNDGFAVHAPVGSFAPNPFGLHDVHGNVMEWCHDSFAYYHETVPRPGDGLLVLDRSPKRVFRGGAWTTTADSARCSWRQSQTLVWTGADIGIRAARALQR